MYIMRSSAAIILAIIVSFVVLPLARADDPCAPSTDGNIVLNPGLECDADGNSIPDSWTRNAADASHLLSWIDESAIGHTSMVLKSEFTGSGTPNSFSWYMWL
jgi:hypothetical protein